MKNNLKLYGGTVRFSSVTIKYLEMESFQIGSRNTIIGRNGSGKSTLCKCLSGVIPEIYKAVSNLKCNVGKVPLFYESKSADENLISVMPQDLQEFMVGVSVQEEWNASFKNPNAINKKTAEKIYSTCKLEKLKDRQSWELSDGEKQRIGFACLLARKSYWYVFDEWQCHMDDNWIKILNSILNEMCEETGCGTIEMTPSQREDLIKQKPLLSEVIFNEEVISSYISERLEALCLLLNEFTNHVSSNNSVTLYHNGKLKRGNFRKRIAPFEARNGQIAIIIGKNGSGKTTLLRGISFKGGLFARKNPSYVLSNPSLQLVAKNFSELLVKSFVELKKSKINRAIDLVCQVLNTSNSLDPLELNVGSKKLLAILLGVLNTNQGLLVDEPFIGLDAESQQLASYALSFAARELNKCVVITSQTNNQLFCQLKSQVLFNEIDL